MHLLKNEVYQSDFHTTLAINDMEKLKAENSFHKMGCLSFLRIKW